MADWIGVDVDDSTCIIEDCINPVWVKVRGFCRKHYKAWYRHGDPMGLPDPTCKTCGKQFPRKGRSGNLAAYCSRGCNPRYRPAICPCKFCGEPFDRKGTVRQHCSISCRDRWRRNGGRSLSELHRDCAACGRAIDLNERGSAGRLRRADTNYCIGCRRPSSYVMTVADLAERDGPNCSICTAPVDMTLAWPDVMAPTIDHVVPWSISRDSSPQNLALAHFGCNIRKRDSVA